MTAEHSYSKEVHDQELGLVQTILDSLMVQTGADPQKEETTIFEVRPPGDIVLMRLSVDRPLEDMLWVELSLGVATSLKIQARIGVDPETRQPQYPVADSSRFSSQGKYLNHGHIQYAINKMVFVPPKSLEMLEGIRQIVEAANGNWQLVSRFHNTTP